jgi:long-chain acyl-CoA synthetase
MRHSEAKFLFAGPDCRAAIADFKENIPSLQAIVSFRPNDSETTLPSIFASSSGLSEAEPRSRDDLAAILYTSGTTGFSKGVMLTHGNLLSNIEQCLSVLELKREERFLSVLPIHHSFEATCGFLLPLTCGASITFASSLRSKDLLEDLKDTQPTAFLVVPLLLEKLYQGFLRNLKKAPKGRRLLFYALRTLASIADPLAKGQASKRLLHRVREKMGLGKLRHLICGGAPLPRWLSREYERLGFPLLQGYGITEAAPVLSVNRHGRCRNESTGPPLPWVEVRIKNPDSDGIGEIVVKGPNVMKGYYKNEEATHEVLKNGWFSTGDLGRMDNDGFLYVTGRKKSLIVTKGGKNISPEEIEEKLLQSPFVKETLVLARIHPRTKNEEIHAIIYPDLEALDEYALEKGVVLDDRKLQNLFEELLSRVNGLLAEYKKIRHFSLRGEEFPKTTTQKIKRYLFEEGGIAIESSDPQGGPLSPNGPEKSRQKP